MTPSQRLTATEQVCLEAIQERDRLAKRLAVMEQRISAIRELPPVVFAADPKEREMLSKDVVVRVLTGPAVPARQMTLEDTA